MANPVSDRRVDTRVTTPVIDSIGMTLRPGQDIDGCDEAPTRAMCLPES